MEQGRQGDGSAEGRQCWERQGAGGEWVGEGGRGTRSIRVRQAGQRSRPERRVPGRLGNRNAPQGHSDRQGRDGSNPDEGDGGRREGTAVVRSSQTLSRRTWRRRNVLGRRRCVEEGRPDAVLSPAQGEVRQVGIRGRRRDSHLSSVQVNLGAALLNYENHAEVTACVVHTKRARASFFLCSL